MLFFLKLNIYYIIHFNLMRKFILILYFLFSTQSVYSSSLCEQLFFTGKFGDFAQDIKDRFQSRSLKNLLKKNSSPETQLRVINSMLTPHRRDIPILKEILKMSPSHEVKVRIAIIAKLIFEDNIYNLSKRNKEDIFNIWNTLSRINSSDELHIELAFAVRTVFEFTRGSNLSKQDKESLFKIVNKLLLEIAPALEIRINIVNLAESVLKNRSNFSEKDISDVFNILNKLLKKISTSEKAKRINQHIQQNLLPQTIQLTSSNKNQLQLVLE